ncbi:M20/M25/M40 family metallo-hydrolase [Mucilaginibacter terrenus]|uniref:M20/M25/M40 family metallo-hydrolase n=1 Tax=Mucilaginibacter terrenus TaxID=2482727 RepID=A0A3E2NTE9_9SPHI|nr:M20/M25/M40 family metallo-hydrolase [Mucilaginibacter terrenus]RFZ84274.1 M20/M25/M40 family metallo-hydrolase [Mucilaginibacter terrenus]
MKLRLLLLLLIITNVALAQDVKFARQMVDTLTSRYFWGRGYTNNGMSKAADFLVAQLKTYGVKLMDGISYKQDFSYPVNTFPGKMEVAINGIQLLPGKDFIVGPGSRGVKGQGKLVQTDSTHFVDQENRIIVSLESKLTFSVEQQAADFTLIQLDKSLQKSIPVDIKADIESKLISNFKTANICGVVKGTAKPDSVIVFTAHYDHLGGMGDKTFFPGANDNASGVTQVLSLAKYYAAHPQPYTIAFIFFAGEEAGLLGSKHFTEHPLLDLNQIRFLVNLDLEGTGVDGITVVNASVFPKEFALLKQVNEKGNYLVKVNSRGKAANSDHYFFSEKGVPAFFMYTLGGIKAYHDIYDVSSTLPMNEYEDIFHLLVNFTGGLMGKPGK